MKRLDEVLITLSQIPGYVMFSVARIHSVEKLKPCNNLGKFRYFSVKQINDIPWLLRHSQTVSCKLFTNNGYKRFKSIHFGVFNFRYNIKSFDRAC
jgi:hypothetical protein